MIKQVRVYYEGWGERWLWGTLAETDTLNSRPEIHFEYSDQAQKRGLELSMHTLPLQGSRLRQGFPAHQLGLPSPVYDALPDGWGMLLMDRYFKRQGLDAARISPLDRLCYLHNTAMGALTFEPACNIAEPREQAVTLHALLQRVEQVQQGQGGQFLAQLLKEGGSPQGARPKVLLYREPQSLQFSTAQSATSQAWLIKFPAVDEPAEVCAIEQVYAHCLALCGIDVPVTEYVPLPEGRAAFASKRFDRQNGQRIPMQTLAAFTGADYRTPGSLDYKSFLRATFACTHDITQQQNAFAHIVFNVVFNNRDDHPKNFSFVMSKNGQWQLAPAYDVTFSEGPRGYHQMDVLGEALNISGTALTELGTKEASLTPEQAQQTINRIVAVGQRFTQHANAVLPDAINTVTLHAIQERINHNMEFLDP